MTRPAAASTAVSVWRPCTPKMVSLTASALRPVSVAQDQMFLTLLD